jgi:hypothetical protein
VSGCATEGGRECGSTGAGGKTARTESLGRKRDAVGEGAREGGEWRLRLRLRLRVES